MQEHGLFQQYAYKVLFQFMDEPWFFYNMKGKVSPV